MRELYRVNDCAWSLRMRIPPRTRQRESWLVIPQFYVFIILYLNLNADNIINGLVIYYMVYFPAPKKMNHFNKGRRHDPYMTQQRLPYKRVRKDQAFIKAGKTTYQEDELEHTEIFFYF